MKPISIGAQNFPQRENPAHHLIHFGLLNILVVGMVTLAFIGKTAVPEARPSRISAKEITAPPDAWSPGPYGRSHR